MSLTSGSSTDAEEAQGSAASLNGFNIQQKIGREDSLAEGRDAGGVDQSESMLLRLEIDELRSADRRKNEFMAILSHELCNPLAAIQSALDLLRKVSPGGAVAYQGVHEVIERQVRHMALLVADLGDVSRIACGQLRLQRDRIDACAILGNAVETLRPDFRKRNQQLSATWSESAIWISADADRLEQVFVNLLANASKYTDSGGEIALTAHVYDGKAIIRVRDCGIGIAPATLPRIFDLFMQADAAAPRSQSGLGIGLALVRTIVELHGGSVIADSAGLGKGSEFTICLPVES